MDPAMVRLAWALLTILTGIFPMLVLYVIWAMVVPEAPAGYLPPSAGGSAKGPGAPESAPGSAIASGDAAARSNAPPSSYGPSSWDRPAGRSGLSGPLIFGLLLIVIGGIFLVRPSLAIDWDVVWPIGLIAVGLAVLFLAYRPRTS
jgi:hypothetical protein